MSGVPSSRCAQKVAWPNTAGHQAMPGASREAAPEMSEEIAIRFGFEENGGCYVTPAGHIDHLWNMLPDGSILDATADQFVAVDGQEKTDIPGDGIRVVASGDIRYDASCECENQIG
jgi:hypothetical protein